MRDDGWAKVAVAIAPVQAGVSAGAPLRKRWAGRVALALLILGALTLAFSVNAPWVSALQQFGDGSLSGTDSFPIMSNAPLLPSSFVATLSNRLLRLLFEPVALLSAGLPLLGVAFAVLCTQPLGRRAWRITQIGCGLWLTLLTLHALHYLILIAQGNVFASQTEPGLTITYTDERPTRGLWLTAVALVGAWVGFVGVWRLRRGARRSSGAAGEPTTRRRAYVRWLAAGGMTLGALLWALGFLALPWTTVNCRFIPPLSFNHFVHGSCAGLDAGDALTAAVPFHPGYDFLTQLNLALTDPFTYYTLLTLGALVVAVYGWRRRIAWAQGGLVIAWLLVATLVALIAARGTAMLIANPIAVSYLATVGQWRISLGLYLTFAALALLWGATSAWLFTTTIDRGPFFTGGQLAGYGARSGGTSFDDDTAPELATLD